MLCDKECRILCGAMRPLPNNDVSTPSKQRRRQFTRMPMPIETLPSRLPLPRPASTRRVAPQGIPLSINSPPTGFLRPRSTSGNGEKKARREIANYNERRRMKSINDGFESLKDILPVDGEKTSKVREAFSSFWRARTEQLSLRTPWPEPFSSCHARHTAHPPYDRSPIHRPQTPRPPPRPLPPDGSDLTLLTWRKNLWNLNNPNPPQAAILQHANDYITELRQEILALKAGRTGVKTPPSAVTALPVTPTTVAPVATFTPPPTVVAVVTTKSPKRRRMSAPTSSVKKTGPAAAAAAGKAATIADRRSSDPTNRSLDVRTRLFFFATVTL